MEYLENLKFVILTWCLIFVCGIAMVLVPLFIIKTFGLIAFGVVCAVGYVLGQAFIITYGHPSQIIAEANYYALTNKE